MLAIPTALTAPQIERQAPMPEPRSLQTRLAAWADRRLLPGVVVLVLAIDVGMGLNWLLANPEQLQSPAYSVAKQVAAMAGWGALLLACSAIAIGVAATHGRSWLTGWLLGGVLSGFWFFWTVCFTLAPLGMHGASFAGAIFALPICLLHLLAGLALSHQPPRMGRDRRG